jgi:hypothetical protein
MPYKYFRMIGYQVPTASPGSIGPPRRPVISGWDAGIESAGIATIPVPATLPDDARIRLKRLAAVVGMAYNRVQEAEWGDNANTLKVFLVPEFYLRPPSSIGPDYVGNTYPRGVGMQIFGALDGMFQDKIFANWLFVCGTVLFNTHDDPMAAPLYFNTAVVVKGGQSQGLRLVEKRVPSNIDGVPQVMFAGVSKAGGPGNDPRVGPYLEKWNQRKDHVMNFGGATVGVEVCLDHGDSQRVLRRVVRDWPKNEVASAGSQDVFARADVQIHILTCGGMGLKPQSVAAKLNGYVVRNDGMATTGARIQMRKVIAYKLNGEVSGILGPLDEETLNASAVLVPVKASARVAVTSADPGWLAPPPPQPYPTVKQSLVFFPPTALP